MEQTKKLPKRTWLTFLVVFLLIPAVIMADHLMGGKNYYIVGVAVIVLTMVPFFLVFEQRRPQARELVTLAVLCALAVASRAVVMVPHFKPMMGIVMIAAIAYGPEAGFLVGAMSGFASNFIFGHGPWTPWQMFAFGMGGFLAGSIYRLHLLPKKKLPMAVMGAVLIVLIVGPLLDTCSVFTMTSVITKESAGAIYLSGLPVNLVHAAATFLTLFFFGLPLLEKLDRIKVKYGMMEDEDDAL